MKEIITQLIAASIDSNKIPGFDRFDMEGRPEGRFTIRLHNGETIEIRVEIGDIPF